MIIPRNCGSRHKANNDTLPDMRVVRSTRSVFYFGSKSKTAPVPMGEVIANGEDMFGSEYFNQNAY